MAISLFVSVVPPLISRLMHEVFGLNSGGYGDFSGASQATEPISQPMSLSPTQWGAAQLLEQEGVPFTQSPFAPRQPLALADLEHDERLARRALGRCPGSRPGSSASSGGGSRASSPPSVVPCASPS